MNGSTVTTPTTNDDSQNDVRQTTKNEIPVVARMWLFICHAMPFRIHLPIPFSSSSLDMSFVVLGALFLATIRLYIAEPLLIHVFGWPDGGPSPNNNDDNDADDAKLPTQEAAANITSICHSTLLCVGLITAFATQPYRPASKLTTAPQWWQDFVDALLQFCTGYMLYDAVVNILWLRLPDHDDHDFSDGSTSPGFPWRVLRTIPLPVLGDDDKLFLVHHMMTSFYMTSTRMVGAGHQSAMICMLLGELSNPLHNSYMLGEVALTQDCCNGPMAQQLHAIISIAFAAVYNLLRVVVGPVVCAGVTFTLVLTKEGQTNIPVTLNVLWNLMIWGVIFGSSSWIQKCHGILKDAIAGVTASSDEEL